jgi:hypothetical protein
MPGADAVKAELPDPEPFPDPELELEPELEQAATARATTDMTAAACQRLVMCLVMKCLPFRADLLALRLPEG